MHSKLIDLVVQTKGVLGCLLLASNTGHAILDSLAGTLCGVSQAFGGA
jgi:hypothetical protein